ncbi:hypothetical protein SLEP1_g49986 [Rubroshorea leprosula]|uniref:Uncharacterized protein n=1 Tax=Rubroshorea leprosula TaxID=152421 RepID=A0AAV5LYJ4_9ROSI|nr:hypothetical protein SLEP1_g49986 [Rubroshorea leprosula]
MGRPVQYRRLTPCPASSPEPEAEEAGCQPVELTATCGGCETDSDLVPLKISLLGDCQIGKTSFVIKYVGDEQERSLQMNGLSLVKKTLFVQGARISFSIWDVTAARWIMFLLLAKMQWQFCLCLILPVGVPSIVLLGGTLKPESGIRRRFQY